MSDRLHGKVAIVTGAGRGLGRAHALELARHGAAVIINDVGTGSDGGGDADSTPAEQVVTEIRAAGGRAAANYSDISDWDAAGQLVAQAVEEFGSLDILVNNAGVLRDRMIFSMTPHEWDFVIAVHLRGTAATTHHASVYWRSVTKSGAAVDASIINTSSASGLYGNPSQSNYGAAKAAIASLTVISAKELARYGVRVNAIAPAARTRLTEALIPETVDTFAPERVSPLVAWLASEAAKDVTGQIFDIGGTLISVVEGWRKGPTATNDTGFVIDDLDALIPDLIARAAPQPDDQGRVEETAK